MKYLVTAAFTLLFCMLFAQTHLEYTNDVMANKLDSTLDNSKINKVAIYGGGSLFGLVSTDDKPDGSIPVSGSLGFSFKSPSQRWAFNLYYSVNGSPDVDVSTYEQLGAAWLAPTNTGNTIKLTLVKRSQWAKVDGKLGWIYNGTITQNTWIIDSVPYKLSPLVARCGAYYRPWNFDVDPNDLNIYTTALITYRGAIGDLFNGYTESLEIEGEQYQLRSYWGFELGIHAMFNNVAVSGLFPINFTNRELPGFTGPQFVIGVQVSGDILVVGKPRDKNNFNYTH